MKFGFGLIVFVLLWHGSIYAAEEPKVLATVKPLPVALDRDFEFRKTKLFLMSEKAPGVREKVSKNAAKIGDVAPSKATTASQDASITFERQYRLFGAAPKLDQHQRFGDYFDFFW